MRPLAKPRQWRKKIFKCSNLVDENFLPPSLLPLPLPLSSSPFSKLSFFPPFFLSFLLPSPFDCQWNSQPHACLASSTTELYFQPPGEGFSKNHLLLHIIYPYIAINSIFINPLSSSSLKSFLLRSLKGIIFLFYARIEYPPFLFKRMSRGQGDGSVGKELM